MENKILVFKLADDFFGVDIATVESIIKIQPITQLPCAPYFVEGVINFHGKVLPIMDLHRRFNLPAQKDTKNSRIVVTSLDGEEVGMVVDGVSALLTIQENDIDPTPRIAVNVDTNFIAGIAKLDGCLVILLDLSMVLSRQERIALAALPALAANDYR